MMLDENTIKELPLNTEEETCLLSEQYHPNSKITLQEALDKGHMLLEDFDRQLRTGSNE